MAFSVSLLFAVRKGEGREAPFRKEVALRVEGIV